MKKKFTALALVVVMVAMLFTGLTLAFFTDTASNTNTFTVGDVEIEVIESQFHRVNGYNTSTDAFDGTADNTPSVGTAAWTGGYYSDDKIKTDAETWMNNNAGDGMLVENLVPGKEIMKNPYVINTGANDAYVRVRVMYPKALENAVEVMVTSTAVNEGEVAVTYGTKTVDNEEYLMAQFTYLDALKPKQMTFWNCIGKVWILDDATEADFNGMTSFDVLVEADAIQAEGFADAAAAFTAFDNP